MEGDETSMKHGKLFCLSPGDALRYLGAEVTRIFMVREGETRLCCVLQDTHYIIQSNTQIISTL